jgi:nucleotidyltransferase AbiEii toxin of type IV toxin-antitoxin system
MNSEPRHWSDYTARQIEAARRVLVDVGQVLAAFEDAIVIVGGWVPDLLLPHAEPEHIGSIDVDLALDAPKLGDGRYAEILNLLLDTSRYRQGEKHFQLAADVDLEDGEPPVRVDVEFLASSLMKLKKNRPKLIEDFRVLQFPACAVAFKSPEEIEIKGSMISGAANTVRVRVASLSDFVIMKAHALGGRDKPKDVYDLCYCLDEYPGGLSALAKDWRSRKGDPLVDAAGRILREKFASVDHYGPQQLAHFHDPTDADERAMHSRRAYELVQKLLNLL